MPKHGYLIVKYSPERKLFMAKHLNPLEREFLIRKFKGNSKVKLGDFCRANNVSETSFNVAKGITFTLSPLDMALS